uniref:Uncharacterized protein n=1 Tax=Desulfovibrio sp. U5L TaxID=596152 RepID=I2Q5D4_9BACT
MLDPFRQGVKGEGLHLGLGFRLSSPIGECAGNFLDLGNESAVLSLVLERRWATHARGGNPWQRKTFGRK